MIQPFTYSSRKITSKDIDFLRRIISENPRESRTALSRRVCREWDWTQKNGALKEIQCRGLMLKLHREGHIKLPPPKWKVNNPLANPRKPDKVIVDQAPIDNISVADLQPIEIQQVRRSNQEKLFNGLIQQYHYLGYAKPVGEHLKFIAFAGGRPIACWAFSSVAYQLLHRDDYIGWTPECREKNRHLLAYNTRFLVLPWVRVPCLASHLLGKCARTISSEWENVYHHPLYWLETFVDTDRFKGTCYKAANWIFLGHTTGRGKYNKTHRQLTSIKAMYGLPLVADFRERLCGE